MATKKVKVRTPSTPSLPPVPKRKLEFAIIYNEAKAVKPAVKKDSYDSKKKKHICGTCDARVKSLVKHGKEANGCLKKKGEAYKQYECRSCPAKKGKKKPYESLGSLKRHAGMGHPGFVIELDEEEEEEDDEEEEEDHEHPSDEVDEEEQENIQSVISHVRPAAKKQSKSLSSPSQELVLKFFQPDKKDPFTVEVEKMILCFSGRANEIPISERKNLLLAIEIVGGMAKAGQFPVPIKKVKSKTSP